MTPEPEISALELHSASSKGNISLKALLASRREHRNWSPSHLSLLFHLFVHSQNAIHWPQEAGTGASSIMSMVTRLLKLKNRG